MPRRVSTAVVLAAFAWFTTLSLELHVHAASESGTHQHAPALHHHDGDAGGPVGSLRITDADADDTAIALRLSAAAVPIAKPPLGASTDSVVLDEWPVVVATDARVVPRAHGPPSARPRSLRAPPPVTAL